MSPSFPGPREPSAYSPTVHFGERFDDRYADYSRHLDGEIIKRCIEDGTGTPDPNGGGKWRLHQTVGGVEYCLVVNPSAGLVITGYPTEITPQASDASRWSSRQLAEIQAFLDQNNDEL